VDAQGSTHKPQPHSVAAGPHPRDRRLAGLTGLGMRRARPRTRWSDQAPPTTGRPQEVRPVPITWMPPGVRRNPNDLTASELAGRVYRLARCAGSPVDPTSGFPSVTTWPRHGTTRPRPSRSAPAARSVPTAWNCRFGAHGVWAGWSRKNGGPPAAGGWKELASPSRPGYIQAPTLSWISVIRCAGRLRKRPRRGRLVEAARLLQPASVELSAVSPPGSAAARRAR
jgi:hypothetical protein